MQISTESPINTKPVIIRCFRENGILGSPFGLEDLNDIVKRMRLFQIVI